MDNLAHWAKSVVDDLQLSLKKTVDKSSAGLEIQRALLYGNVAVVLGMMLKAGLDKIVFSKACSEQKIVLVIVAFRIIDPLYKLATVCNISNGIATSLLGSDLGLDEKINEEFYKDMDGYYADREELIKSWLKNI